MKKLISALLLFLFSLSLSAQKTSNVNLPPDEVRVVDHVVQPGENYTTIWESYGQKFKLKEYKKYNTEMWLKTGMTLHVPVHTTDPAFLTKSQYNSVLARYASSPVSETAPAGATAEGVITKVKLSPYNGDDFKMYIEIKGEVKWLAGRLLGIDYFYYDINHKKKLKLESYTLKIKKDKHKLSMTESVPFADLPHKNGENQYSVSVELYNPQDKNKVLYSSDWVDFSLTWDGNKVRTTNLTKSEKVLNFLNGLETVASVFSKSGNSSSSSSTKNGAQSLVKGVSSATSMAGASNASGTTGQYNQQSSTNQLSESEMYVYDAELDYALTHTNNQEANNLMLQAMEINRNAKLLAKRLDALNDEYREKKAQLQKESSTGVRSTTTTRQTSNGTRVTTVNNRSVKGKNTGSGRTVVGKSNNGRKISVGSNTKESREKALDDWFHNEHSKLMSEAGKDHGLNEILSRYCQLTGIPAGGRSKTADDSDSPCVYCKGSGICYLCKGGGAGETHFGVTGKCKDCHGTGKCTHCGKRSSSSGGSFDPWPDAEAARAKLIYGKKNSSSKKKSGSSGSSKSSKKDTNVEVDCGYCHGSGDCYMCNGHGLLDRGTTNERTCHLCREYKLGKCKYCKGTGKVTRTVKR